MADMLRPRSFVHGLLALGLVMAMVACDGDDKTRPAGGSTQSDQADDQQDEGTITIQGQEANDHGQEDVSGTSTVELEADDFYFEPTVLVGDAGQELTIHVTNEGDSPHNFSIELAEIDENIDPGEDVEIDVVIPETGTLVYFCSFHQDGGMLGGLQPSS
jgi:plastocyanin